TDPGETPYGASAVGWPPRPDEPGQGEEEQTMSKYVGIDVLNDCAYSAQSPSCFATDEDNLDAAEERFLELAAPHFIAAGERLGVEVIITRDERKLAELAREWGDDEDEHAAW